MAQLIHVAIGGVLGTLARYLLTGVVGRIAGTAFPYGTLLVNVTGCFLIGLLASLAEYRLPFSPHGHLMFIAGFCGAFTTFSAIMLDTHVLLGRGAMVHAAVNILGSVMAGLLAFRLGAFVADLL